MGKPFNPVLPPKEAQRKCVECGKPVDDYWGNYVDGGVCSKICDVLHMQKRRDELFNHKGEP